MQVYLNLEYFQVLGNPMEFLHYAKYLFASIKDEEAFSKTICPPVWNKLLDLYLNHPHYFYTKSKLKQAHLSDCPLQYESWWEVDEGWK